MAALRRGLTALALLAGAASCGAEGPAAVVLGEGALAGRSPPVAGLDDGGTCELAALRAGVDALTTDFRQWSPASGRPFASAARAAGLLWSACPEPPLAIAVALDRAAHDDTGAGAPGAPDAVDRRLPGHDAVHLGEYALQRPELASTLRRLAAHGCPEYATPLADDQDVDWESPELWRTCGLGQHGFEPRARYDMRTVIAVVGWLRARGVPQALAEPLADALANTTASKLHGDTLFAPTLELPASPRSGWSGPAARACDLELGLTYLRFADVTHPLDPHAPEVALAGVAEIDPIMDEAAARSDRALRLRIDRRMPTRVLRALVARARAHGVRTLAVEVLTRFADLPVEYAAIETVAAPGLATHVRIEPSRALVSCAGSTPIRIALPADQAVIADALRSRPCPGALQLAASDDVPLSSVIAIAREFHFDDGLSPAPRRARSRDRGR